MTARSRRHPSALMLAAFLAGAATCVLILGPSAGATVTGRALWVARYDGRKHVNTQRGLAVSPDGSKVFVTGESAATRGASDYVTLAYDPSTGATLWRARYHGPVVDASDGATAIGASPDGSKVFVTGTSHRTKFFAEYATIAYAASTGAPLWVRRYHYALDHSGSPQSLAVSPDGSRVFVTGQVDGKRSWDYGTVAYDASTGAQLWGRIYNDPLHAYDQANAVSVSPDGSRVFVTGYITGKLQFDFDYGTVAYDASTGARLWVAQYSGGYGFDQANAVTVSPDGSKVFVTGESPGANTNVDYATIAYDASSGTQLWFRRYNGPHGGDDLAAAIGVSPNGFQVYVTGTSVGPSGQAPLDVATVAYGASNGATVWVKRYNGPADGNDGGNAIAASPDGSKVFVAGETTPLVGYGNDYLTLAYPA